jgi:hypothetical protein
MKTKTQRAITNALKKGNEVCICSAIKWRGKVWPGMRHGDCMEAMRRELGWKMTGERISHSHMFNEQGFITNRNRYVTREEALRLHLAAGIPSHAEQTERGKKGGRLSERHYVQ